MADSDWYLRVSSDDLEQGDIITDCPVPLIALDTSVQAAKAAIEASGEVPTVVNWKLIDLVILSQTCDMVQSHDRKPKIQYALLAPIWPLSSHESGFLASTAGKEIVRRGMFPAAHMLGPCKLDGLNREVSTIDFQTIYTLPLTFVRETALGCGDRLRLASPYKESLSQAFARFLMRVGLPQDLPPFADKLKPADMIKAIRDAEAD